MVTIRYDSRPWTANAARAAKHWASTARLTSEWRNAFAVLACECGVGELGPTIVTVTPYLRDRRGKQDVGACFPAAKAAIDGICDAGAWPDDDATNVVELRFNPPVYGHGDALEIRLEPADTFPVGGPHIHTR